MKKGQRNKLLIFAVALVVGIILMLTLTGCAFFGSTNSTSGNKDKNQGTTVQPGQTTDPTNSIKPNEEVKDTDQNQSNPNTEDKDPNEETKDPNGEIKDPNEKDPNEKDPNKSDEEVKDPAATQADLLRLRDSINSKFAGNSIWEVVADERAIYSYVTDDTSTRLYKVSFSEKSGIETKGQVDSLINDVNSFSLTSPVAMFKASEENIEYNGYIYNKNAIKGSTSNPFANRVGVTTNSSVTSIIPNITNRELSLIINVVTSNKTYIAKITADVDSTLSDSDFNNLSAEEKQAYFELGLSKLLDSTNSKINLQTIPYGMRTSDIKATVPTKAPEKEPDQPIVKPDDPTIDPDDPNKKDPDNPPVVKPEDPVTLDYSELESKLETIITSQSKSFSVNQILAYGINDGKLNVAFDYKTRVGNSVAVYECNVGDVSLKDKEDLENIISNFNVKNFTEIIHMARAKSDITINGKTYINGDLTECTELAEKFEDYLSINNINKIWLSEVGMAGESFNSGFPSGYSSGIKALVIYNENGNFKIKNCRFNVESYSGDSKDKMYSNLLINEKTEISKMEEVKEINIGKNIKSENEKIKE